MCGVLRQPPLHELAAASAQVSQFLKGFIAETDPRFPRYFRPKSYLQRFLQIPPDMNLEANVQGSSFGAAAQTGGHVIMYADPSLAVEELIFRGVELDLILFDLLVRASACLRAQVLGRAVHVCLCLRLCLRLCACVCVFVARLGACWICCSTKCWCLPSSRTSCPKASLS